VDLREPEPAVLLGHLHAHGADALESVDDVVRDLRGALDLERVDLGLEDLPQLGEELLALLGRGGVELGLRVDEVQTEVAEEELLAEARQLPLRLAGRLGDLACFLLADVRGHPLRVRPRAVKARHPPGLGRKTRRVSRVRGRV
jgi:hypothetical protein